jgi:protein-disulfide isomerase
MYRAIDSALANDPEWLTVRFRHFIPEGSGNTLFNLAVAAECAARQGLFAAFAEWVYRNLADAHAPVSSGTAEAIGVAGLPAFDSCLVSASVSSLVFEDWRTGSELGIEGTPTVFTRRYRVVGTLPLARLKELASKK